MQLPQTLRDAIENRLARHPASQIAEAARQLGERYRTATAASVRTSEFERLAYLVVRLPAALAAVETVLAELRGRLHQTPVRSLLDLGAGPGTVALAAASLFPSIERMHLVEQEPAWAHIGQELLEQAGVTTPTSWKLGDFFRTSLPEADLTVAAYSLAGAPLDCAAALLGRAWESTSVALVVIEPGTPEGFLRIRTYRDQLISLGAHIAAPCPHDDACPMREPDWCHFAQRVEDSALQRYLTEDRLGYEDEKFSFVAAVRMEVERAESRVVRRPLIQPGVVSLQLCTRCGTEVRKITHTEGERFKQARKSRWGDSWRE